MFTNITPSSLNTDIIYNGTNLQFLMILLFFFTVLKNRRALRRFHLHTFRHKLLMICTVRLTLYRQLTVPNLAGWHKYNEQHVAYMINNFTFVENTVCTGMCESNQICAWINVYFSHKSHIDQCWWPWMVTMLLLQTLGILLHSFVLNTITSLINWYH